MNTYRIVMVQGGAGSKTQDVEAESLAQAAFIAGAHWAANVATESTIARIFGAEQAVDTYLPLLEDGTVILEGTEV